MVTGLLCLSIFEPTDSEQKAHRYSYLSPSARTRRRRFRTGTARLHLGQYNCVASNSLNESGPAFCRVLPARGFVIPTFFIINKTFYFRQIAIVTPLNITGFVPGNMLIRSFGYYFLYGVLSTSYLGIVKFDVDTFMQFCYLAGYKSGL